MNRKWKPRFQGLEVIKRPRRAGNFLQLAAVSLRREASCTMSVTNGKTGLSLTQEILSHLGLAKKVGAAGTVGTIFTLSTQGMRGLGTGKQSGP